MLAFIAHPSKSCNLNWSSLDVPVLAPRPIATSVTNLQTADWLKRYLLFSSNQWPISRSSNARFVIQCGVGKPISFPKLPYKLEINIFYRGIRRAAPRDSSLFLYRTFSQTISVIQIKTFILNICLLLFFHTLLCEKFLRTSALIFW